MKRGRFQKAARRKKRDVALKMFSNSKNVTSIGIVSWGRWDGSPLIRGKNIFNIEQNLNLTCGHVRGWSDTFPYLKNMFPYWE